MAENNKLSISALVDRGYELNVIMKDVEKELSAIKQKLKAEAEKQKVNMFSGKMHTAIFSEKTVQEVPPKAFYQLLKKENKATLFWETVKVSLEKARKIIPELDLEKISKIEVKPWATIIFK